MQDFGGKSYVPEPPPTQDEKTMALVAHILGLFTCALGPGIIWLIKKEQSAYIARAALLALVWQLVLFVPNLILSCLTGGLAFPLFLIANIFYVVVACMQVNEGKQYDYPVIGGFIK